MGKELKEDLYLYSYDITDEMTVQAMVRIPPKPTPVESDDDDDDDDDDEV